MKTSDKPFLDSYKDNFEIGELVWWNEWDTNENYQQIPTVRHGAIIKIKVSKNFFNERPVYVAVVLPFGSTVTRELSLHLLKKRTN